MTLQSFYGPPNDLAVQRGGAGGTQYGLRAVPSLRYTQGIPPFTEHYFEDEGDDSIDQGPAGGRTWDGRAQSTHEQAQLPLFSPLEMANRDRRKSSRRCKTRLMPRNFAGYSATMCSRTGYLGVQGHFDVAGNIPALKSPADFYPYSSKYDAYLRHEATLTPEEARGLAAFNDVKKGNCARCHPSAMRHGAFPQFTDFGFAAVGAPRNAAIPANADGRYYDLGLCGPLRTDLKSSTRYCGMFRSPSLRNVATRRVFFHNGVFHQLEDVVRFYATRDTRPQEWYPRAADGRILKYDDLPVEFRGNVDVEPPFDRHAGDEPAFNEQDIRDIVAFLKALMDGFQPLPVVH